jgi:hypothetical protein
MPAAKYSLDFDTGKLYDGTGAQIQALSLKKNSVRDYELSINQVGVAISLPSGSTVKTALKKTSSPGGTLLMEFDAVRGGWGTGSRWFVTLDLTDDLFTAVLGTSVDFEILMELPDGQRIRSLTIPFTIAKYVMA